jgi:MFS superfamily sulfate permease-like transporter
VIPESLAYASLAGLPPVSGLYCYLAAGLAYAVFGTSRQLAVGPTSALALAVAAGIAALDGGDPARAAALAAAIALMVGVIAIGGRFLGLANLAYFFSDSVVTGFKTGDRFASRIEQVQPLSRDLPSLHLSERLHERFFQPHPLRAIHSWSHDLVECQGVTF